MKRDRETQKYCGLLIKCIVSLYITKIKDMRQTKHLKERKKGI